MLKDDNGKWADHATLVKEACQGVSGLTSDKIEAIVAGTVYVDKDQNNQFMHSMLSPTDINNAKGIRDEAIKVAGEAKDKFISDNENQFLKNGDYFALGMAVHPISDEDAPAHTNWQVWNGPLDLGISIPHIFGDMKTLNPEAWKISVAKTRELIQKLIQERESEKIENQKCENDNSTTD